MSTNLKKMTVPVQQLLKEKGIRHRIIELPEKAYTVADVVRLSKGAVRLEETCKTIILRGKKSGALRAMLMRGSDRIKFSEARKKFGEELAIAEPQEVKEAAGTEPGAVCPFLVRVPLFVDEQVLLLPRINTGSGHHFYGLEFDPNDIARVVRYETIDIAK